MHDLQLRIFAEGLTMHTNYLCLTTSAFSERWLVYWCICALWQLRSANRLLPYLPPRLQSHKWSLLANNISTCWMRSPPTTRLRNLRQHHFQLQNPQPRHRQLRTMLIRILLGLHRALSEGSLMRSAREKHQRAVPLSTCWLHQSRCSWSLRVVQYQKLSIDFGAMRY